MLDYQYRRQALHAWKNSQDEKPSHHERTQKQLSEAASTIRKWFTKRLIRSNS